MKCLKNQQTKESRWASGKALNVVKNTQIKIAIKMLVRNNQTLKISEIVGLDLNALRELKRVFD